MSSFVLSEMTPALPEIWMACGAMALLMLGVFSKENTTGTASAFTVLILLVALILVLVTTDGRTVAMSGMYVSDDFARFVKSLVLLGSAASVVMSRGFLRREKMERFEYPILILLATLGMMMMVSANDLMSLYVGLELQSLSLYVLATFQRKNARSTEAGLKYFILGALASGLLLYGCSLIYGFTGTTNFDALAALAGEGSNRQSTGILIGLVFLIAGLAFKVSAVPFHMWTPDVYEGSPTPVTAFFAVAPKIAALALLIRALMGPFPDMSQQWGQIIVFLSIGSMVLGAFAAIGQNNIKRLMAYSSIGHMGFALIGLAAGTIRGIEGVLIYAAIYLVMTAGAFACILAMRHEDGMTENIEDLAGLSRNQPLLAAALAIFMFSLAGIPPLAGFFGKFYIFLAAIDAGLYTLAVIGVLASVVGAFYYVRIIKIMYFDEPAEPFEQPVDSELGVIVGGAAIFTLLFIAYPTPIIAGARTAAAALFP